MNYNTVIMTSALPNPFTDYSRHVGIEPFNPGIVIFQSLVRAVIMLLNQGARPGIHHPSLWS